MIDRWNKRELENRSIIIRSYLRNLTILEEMRYDLAEELDHIEALGIIISPRNKAIIKGLFYTQRIKDKDVSNTLYLVKKIYIALTGTEEGFSEFIDRHPEFFTSYNSFKIRAAILSHFNLLEEAFLNTPELLSNQHFDKINSIDFYRILYTYKDISSLEEFIQIAVSMPKRGLQILKNTVPFSDQELNDLVVKLNKTLDARIKKNAFLNTMKNRKKQ